MRRDARRVFNRVASGNRDWCKIQNKADDEDVTQVYIYDEIGFWGTEAADFANQLREIETPKIELHLNTPGGDVFDGVAIYNALKQHPAEVTVIVDALAASAGSFIAQAGEKIVMTRNATMMIHDASIMAWGNEQDMLDAAKLLGKISDNIADIYAFNAGGTVPEWRAMMKAETWYSAPEAVEAGLADEMLDADDDEAEEAKNKWDLSVFNHKGREDAPSPKQVRVTVLNQIKEASMGKAPVAPKSEADTQTPPEGAQPAEDTETQPEGTPAEGGEPTPSEPQPATPSVPEPGSGQAANKLPAGSFKIGNKVVTDPVAVQAHIDNLETFQTETMVAGRKAFVAGLATSNKIAASQITDLEEFALGLTDEQYEKWTATWNAAGSLPALGSHVGGGDGGTGEPGATDAKAEEIEKCKAIVRQHKLGNMQPDQIKATDSYKRLLELDPDFKL
jgi:ATP-dependent protease ClpP protease subunit